METQIIYNISQEEPVEVQGINKYLGLMFKMDEHTKPLIFKFSKPCKKPIHSIFCFISFIAEWTFEDGTKEEMLVTPFLGGIKPVKPYIQLIERPLILQTGETK